MIIDAHCHIDLYPDPRIVLQHSANADMIVLAMTNLPSHFEMGYSYFQSLKKVRLALGLHPLMADLHHKEFNLFLKNVDKTSYIGEVGLDFSNEGISTKGIQIETFDNVLKVVSGQKKILSLHSRRAEFDVLELLKKYKIKNAIFHWYSGDLGLIKEISAAGYFFSINPAMTRSLYGRKIISKIPRHFILTETDGPFIEENNSTIQPGRVETVISFLANEWQIAEENVKNIIYSNFQNLINNLKSDI